MVDVSPRLDTPILSCYIMIYNITCIYTVRTTVSCRFCSSIITIFHIPISCSRSQDHKQNLRNLGPCGVYPWHPWALPNRRMPSNSTGMALESMMLQAAVNARSSLTMEVPLQAARDVPKKNGSLWEVGIVMEHG